MPTDRQLHSSLTVCLATDKFCIYSVCKPCFLAYNVVLICLHLSPWCRGHPTGARLPLVHSQCWCRLLFGPFFLAPALHNTPASFLQTTIAQLHRQQDHRQGCRHKDTRTMQTHTLWNAQRPQTRTDFPKVCSTTEQSR